MKELSSKQDQILEFLRTFIDDRDYPPSIRDIQEGCGISSTSVVDYNLRKLEEKGMIRRDREVSRGIEVLGARGGRRARIVEIPVLGSIAAGQPIPVPTAERWGNDAEDTVAVTEDMVRGKTNVFADNAMELGLSAKGKNFLGGIMKHASALAAITNPTVNSYKRINAPRTISGATWAPNTVTWTGNNRTHMVRVPGR